MNQKLTKILKESNSIDFKTLFESVKASKERRLLVFLYQHQHFVVTAPRFSTRQTKQLNLVELYNDYCKSLRDTYNSESQQEMSIKAHEIYLQSALCPPIFHDYCIWLSYYFHRHSIKGLDYPDYYWHTSRIKKSWINDLPIQFDAIRTEYRYEWWRGDDSCYLFTPDMLDKPKGLERRIKDHVERFQYLRFML